MNTREKSLVYSIILILPMLWSFLTLSDLNKLLRLYIIVPCILFGMLLFYLLKRKDRFERSFQKAANFFIYFSIYMFTVSFFARNIMFSLNLILVLSTVFTFSFLGTNIKYFGYIGYVYAIIAAVIIVDFNSGGLTAGWNPNVIGLIVINGVYLLFLTIDKKHICDMVLKIMFAALLLILITNTECRSVYTGFVAFMLLRYVIFNIKSINYSKYKIICTLLMISPFLLVRFYLLMYNSPNAASIDEYIFDLTGKRFFSGREYVWDIILKNDFNSVTKWIGNGFRHGNPHNIYMDVRFSYGIIGVILFVIFLLIIIFTLYKHFRDPVIKSCISCFYGMVITQCFETVSFANASESFNNILYLFLAIAIGRYIDLEKREYSMKKRINVSL